MTTDAPPAVLATVASVFADAPTCWATPWLALEIAPEGATIPVALVTLRVEMVTHAATTTTLV